MYQGRRDGGCPIDRFRKQGAAKSMRKKIGKVNGEKGRSEKNRGREESEMPEMEKARERSKKREKRIRERSGEGSLLVVVPVQSRGNGVSE